MNAPSSLKTLQISNRLSEHRAKHLDEISDVVFTFSEPPTKAPMMSQDNVTYQAFASAPILGAPSKQIVNDLDTLQREFMKALREGEVEVHFNNTQNQPSIMRCTLMESLIPTESRIKQSDPVINIDADPKYARFIQPSRAVKVYATDRGGWRTVRVDRITELVK